jgi:NADH:ubiquinone oxidoreductase subunit 3 (subunit A)
MLGYAIFILFMSKLLIHAYLDRRNGYDVKFEVFSLMQYILPYDKGVATGDEERKKICNSIYKLTILLFVLNIIILLLLNFIHT